MQGSVRLQSNHILDVAAQSDIAKNTCDTIGTCCQGAPRINPYVPVKKKVPTWARPDSESLFFLIIFRKVSLKMSKAKKAK